MRLMSKGQATIPEKIRERAGFKPRDEVEFEFEKNSAVRRPARRAKLSVGQEAVALLRGSATANPDITTNKWMQISRGER